MIFAEDLLENKTSPATRALVVKGLFLFVAAVCLLAIVSNSALSDGETVFYRSVRAFVEQPDIKLDQLSAYKVKVYLFSFPYKLGAPSGQGRQVLFMRSLGVIWLGLALWLSYLTAKRVAPENNLISLATLAFLATNNQLLLSAVTVGGDAWLWLFFTFLIYELVEIAAKGSLLDIFISLGLIFVLSKFDLPTAEKVALPILFLVIVATLIAAYPEWIAKTWRRLAVGARAAVVVAGIAGLIFAQRFRLPAMLLAAPVSLFIVLINFAAWPAMIRQLVPFFSDNPGLAAGFAWAKIGMGAILLLTSLAGAAGLAWLIYRGISDPRRVTEDYHLPALLAIAFIPLTVFTATGTNALSSLLSNPGIYALAAPLAILLSVGLREILAKPSARIVAVLPAALFSLNAASLLLTVLWR